MKTIVLDQPGHLRLTDTQPPSLPGPDEALVRVKCVGICGTDFHAFEGEQPFFSYPRILGHELAVEIVALGPTDGTGLSTGDQCTVEPYLNCGECSTCRRGKPNCCPNLRVLGVHIDGGMRELITVPAIKLHRAKAVPLDHLALAEMLSIGAHAVRRAKVKSGEDVLVIGAGPIGLSVARFAQLAGARTLVMEVSDHRLKACQENLGLGLLVDAKRDPLPQLYAFLSGDLPTVVFDATGSRASMMKALEYAAHGGRLVFVGLVQGEVAFNDPEFHRREMTLLSSRNATGEDFARVIRALETGTIDLTRWITHRASPESIVSEFPRWLRPESNALKPLLVF
jgi:2-desacetyl-2-hydroxyethyl bacteriochlorophyllide A dehydrogenase